jgi:Beta-ketoacyl synthase, N-terminal domain
MSAWSSGKGEGPRGQRPRVVLTGMGTVNASSVGGTEAVAGALTPGRRAIGRVRAFATDGCPSHLGAEVEMSTLAPLLNRETDRRLSRVCQLTVAACRLAAADSNIPGGPHLGIVVGSEFGDVRSSEEFFAAFLRRGPAGLSPLIFPNTVMNTMASAAAIALDARAVSVTINQATIAGDLAVIRAAALVAGGYARTMLAGGVDELCAPLYRHLAALGALSPTQGGGIEGCRPYAPDHNGPVLGEGATFLVLEELESAMARGATIHAEVRCAMWGNIPTAPHTAQHFRVDVQSPVRRFLAELAPGRFLCCYGSANGDPGVDDWEIALLHRDLPDALRRPGIWPPQSLAPQFGQHGGLGALRVAAAALDAARGMGPVLVHGIARGGCRTALLIGAPQ